MLIQQIFAACIIGHLIIAGLSVSHGFRDSGVRAAAADQFSEYAEVASYIEETTFAGLKSGSAVAGWVATIILCGPFIIISLAYLLGALISSLLHVNLRKTWSMAVMAGVHDADIDSAASSRQETRINEVDASPLGDDTPLT